MTQTEFKELKQQLPESTRKLIEIAREIYGDEIPRFIREELEEEAMKKGWERGVKKGMKQGMEVGMEKGMESRDRDFTIKILQKFPEWSDAEVAEFVGVTLEFVQQLRSELAA